MQIKAFLSQFRRSNQKIAKIKKGIFNDLQKKDLIDSRFKLVSETGKEDKLTKLSTSSFTKSYTVCFYEKIQSKEIKLTYTLVLEAGREKSIEGFSLGHQRI